ncbi:MAG: hypothetical protein JXR97_15105, partial [Planctomycetes bacterium]|nr:hypothetical protein [Planctomycetota bacterium]
MSQDQIVASCGKCRAKFNVGPKHYGKSGNCPTCGAPMVFPAPEGMVAENQKIKAPCQLCGAVLTLPLKAAGKKVKCPSCGKPTLIDPKTAKKIKSAAPGEMVVKKAPKEDRKNIVIDDSDRKAFNAFEVMQKSKEDSYWVAMWRAFLYPFNAFGAIVFFVIGIPVTIALAEIIAKWALMWGGDVIENPDGKVYFAAGVTCISMAVIAAMFSFFCSFLFSVVRTSATGRQAVPVIDGMNHRSNLAAMLAWAGVYFGPG